MMYAALCASVLIIIELRAAIDKYLPKPNTATITTGITNIQTKTISNFESIDISKCISNKRAHIINAGGSIWGLDFVPKPSSDKRSDQYLAIGGYNTTTEHHLLCEDLDVENRLNAIQIWKCKSLTSSFTPTLDMCILHDFGVVVDFKWCLFSVYDNKVRYKCYLEASMISNRSCVQLETRHFGCHVQQWNSSIVCGAPTAICAKETPISSTRHSIQ